MELTINGEVYNFKFGIGFLKTINQKHIAKTPQGIDKPIGFVTCAAGLMDGDILDLVEVLATANATEDKRVKREDLENYLDDEATDIDQVFRDTLDFLSKSNACKKHINTLIRFLEKNKTEDDVITFPVTTD